MELKNGLTVSYNSGRVIKVGDDGYHENFGFQWNLFNKLQLDSYNGSTESFDRLLDQSDLNPDEFKNKIILEVGAGSGRFTEVLLSLGAKVIAVDYSSAINANFQNNLEFVDNQKLICVQSDLFEMPVQENFFDMVICYGVIQHTGRNMDSLNHLTKFVKQDGYLLVDIYSNSIRHLNPWIYAIRPFFFLVKDNKKKLNLVKKFVNFMFPIQLYLIKKVFNKGGIYKYIRYFLYRSPNSVYGINLYLSGKISLDIAKEWDILNTFDAWMPQHDHPVSFKKWSKMIQEVVKRKSFDIVSMKECGQGNCATLKLRNN